MKKEKVQVDILSLLQTMLKYCKGKASVEFGIDGHSLVVTYRAGCGSQQKSQMFCYGLLELHQCRIPASEILFKDFEQFVRAIR